MPTSHRRAKLPSSERNLLEIKASPPLWSRNARRMGYKLPLPADFPEPNRLWKRPSTRSALSDGLLVSADVHFKKDRQKYRQPIQLLTSGQLNCSSNSHFNSTSYEIRAEDQRWAANDQQAIP
jgi:hypothetical protein